MRVLANEKSTRNKSTRNVATRRLEVFVTVE